MKKEEKHVSAVWREIKILLAFYVIALVISGATAMVVPEGLHWLVRIVPKSWTTIYNWLDKVLAHIVYSPKFLLYGFDWLAFAHYVIAMSFYGVWKDAVRNKWVIEWAMLASIAIFPMAFMMGYLRGIPFWWQLIDCSFGVVSLIPLIMMHRRIKVMEKSEIEECRVLKFF